MRAMLVVCLLAGCASSPRSTAPAQRAVARGDAWSVAYRLVLDDPAGPRLEGRAEITNTTTGDWSDAKLTLATASSVIDRDGDGIRDGADLCPSDREDVDGHNDDDGCPESDNDSDRIVDETDRCPNEPETYNGHEDDDGCPDRGKVQIDHHGGGIVEWIYFAPGGDVVKPVSFAIIDAVASTILGNPQLRVIEISGHADRTERDPWSLSLRRAAAVRQRLIDQGVAPERLTLGPYGALQPNASGTSAGELARNRRAGFAVVKREDDVVVAPLQPAVRRPFDPPPPELIDDLRYELAQPVTLRRGAAATLSILDKPVIAREVLLWQPDPEVEGSRVHPFRAVRLVNTSGFVLQRGPIEIVVGGEVVGRAVLRRLGIGETAWVRGDLDRGTSVVAVAGVTEQPLRVVGGDRGELVVEDLRRETMTYTITAGTARPLEVHHRRLANHTAHALPSATSELADRWIATREVAAGAVTTFEIVEQQPRRRNRRVDSMTAGELAVYLDGSKLPPEVADPLRAALTPMAASESHHRTLALERFKLREIAVRWQRAQRPLDRATERELEEVGRAIGQASALVDRERMRLDELIAKLPTW